MWKPTVCGSEAIMGSPNVFVTPAATGRTGGGMTPRGAQAIGMRAYGEE